MASEGGVLLNASGDCPRLEASEEESFIQQTKENASAQLSLQCNEAPPEGPSLSAEAAGLESLFIGRRELVFDAPRPANFCCLKCNAAGRFPLRRRLRGGLLAEDSDEDRDDDTTQALPPSSEEDSHCSCTGRLFRVVLETVAADARLLRVRLLDEEAADAESPQPAAVTWCTDGAEVAACLGLASLDLWICKAKTHGFSCRQAPRLPSPLSLWGRVRMCVFQPPCEAASSSRPVGGTAKKGRVCKEVSLPASPLTAVATRGCCCASPSWRWVVEMFVCLEARNCHALAATTPSFCSPLPERLVRATTE